MEQIRTWFRAQGKRHCNCNCHDHEQTGNRPLEVNKPEDMPIKKPEDAPIEKSTETPADTPVCKTAKQQDSITPPSRHIEVLVVPVLDDNDTTTSAIAKGLTKVSDAIKILNGLAARGHTSVTETISKIIINVINTMATVHDQEKPRRIHAYHVYATRTVIASYINIRTLLLNTYPGVLGTGTALSDAFGACVYLGMATLVTPALTRHVLPLTLR